MSLLATSSVVGIIVGIALVASTIAVCLYLYSLKGKPSGEDEPPSTSEETEQK